MEVVIYKNKQTNKKLRQNECPSVEEWDKKIWMTLPWNKKDE